MRVLIIGDSQAGNPGAAAKRALEALGHTVVQVHNDGQGPRAYVSTSTLWQQYVALARDADVVVLLFGHNDQASAALQAALVRMRDGVSPPVWMSGPPQYPAPTDQAQGALIRAVAQSVFGARYIDAWPTTPVSLPRDAAGWHLTPAAAGPWGNAIANAVAGNAVAGSGGAGWLAVGVGVAIAAAVAASSARGAGGLRGAEPNRFDEQIERTRRALDYESPRDVAQRLVSDGTSREQAYLLVRAAQLLEKRR
jgi:hypothetical protein